MLLASRNPDKIQELRELLSALNVSLHSMLDFPTIPDVVEDHDTIFGNAMKKAIHGAQLTGMLCIADDTGLFVDALNGEPGVYSARYAGESCSYLDNRRKLMFKMQDQEVRSARFCTAIALADPKGIVAVVSSTVEGEIVEFERGSNGFGYDNAFEVQGLGKTYAEMSDDEKNRCSHRSFAIQKILPILKRVLDTI